MRKRAVGSWIWDVARPLRAVLGEVMALSVFVNGLGLAVPVFVMQVYDRVVFHGSISTLVGLAAGMMIALAFDFLMRLARARILQTVALRIDVTVGRRLVGQLVGLPLAEIEQRPAASWHALFRDIDTVRNTLSGATAVLVCDIPFLAFFLALMFVIAEPVAWVVVAVLPVFMAIAWLSARRLVGQGGGERRATIGRDTLVAEFVAGRTTIKALGLDAGLKPLWERRHAETIEAGSAAAPPLTASTLSGRHCR
jgi:ABC-type bacteriocin/lantibiotic exporter with double-glycine peptidase domain